jgi:hypothetical protein
MSQIYRASRCPCGHRGCKSWHVEPVAATQGVSFNEEEAKVVAAFLNNKDEVPRLIDNALDLVDLHEQGLADRREIKEKLFSLKKIFEDLK